MMPARLPILVLAGSDREPGRVPAGLRAEDMLTGLKGAHRLASGRRLAGEMIERVKASGCFAAPLLLGPRPAYEGLVDCEIVDVEGNLAATLACVRAVLHSRFAASEPVALTSCDILPTPDDIRRLLDESYAPHADTALWGQFVEATADAMGASAWKPSYAFLREAGGPLLKLYPGHLVIIRPAALRIRLMNHVLDIAYRQRNRALGERGWPMIVGGLGPLIVEDARNLLRLRPSALSVRVPYHILRAYARYRQQRLSVPEFAETVARLFVTRTFRRARANPAAVISVTRILSFGKDIDTTQELTEVAQSAS